MSTQVTSNQQIPTAPSSSGPRRSALWRRLANREMALLLACVVELIVLGQMSPYFLTVSNLFDASRYFAESGLIALGMSLVIMTGGIDLSVGSVLALVSVVIGFSFKAGVPLELAIALGLLTGLVCGFFNGVFIARLGLLPLTVTLGTLALFRGLAYAITGADSVSTFPLWFSQIGGSYVGQVPDQLIFFLIVGALVWLLMNRTRFGRYVSAIGFNEEAARFSGVPVRRVKTAVYVIAGGLVGLSSLIYTSRVFSARADAGVGIELTAITAVVLGGASIMGGSGTVVGTLLAAFLLTFLQNGLIIASVPGELQSVIVGAALLIGVFLNARVGRAR
ncbi:MAG TPA: ABC transporter permease [Baekduia sp.]|uniref:ABC transporter permease n=1 Tax=Baekduia sp. TaxID=2600305 RepID=UPI002D78F0C0|nr:ABC transporter permease [Baekduia sp.]HET6507968.1 ABC transporter permease [Baekduia sp.]